MTYTINGKQYTELDINLAIAEINILSFDMSESMDRVVASQMRRNPPNYCQNSTDTWPIIEKCWDELNESTLRNGGRRKSRWQDTMQQHKCTKLIAACICFIESKEEV
jgi:hypothetical protein